MNNLVRVANVLLLNENHEALLLKRSDNLRNARLFGFPGGLVEKEDSYRAGLRELYEETGIPEAAIVVHGVQVFLVATAQMRMRIHLLRASIAKTPSIVLDPYEHLEHEWRRPEAIYDSVDVLEGIPTMTALALSAYPITDKTLAMHTDIHELAHHIVN